VDASQAPNNHELIVVASLIDKLPNLGGLARTCEVLGVKTLILGLKSQAEKSDFTNLRYVYMSIELYNLLLLNFI